MADGAARGEAVLTGNPAAPVLHGRCVFDVVAIPGDPYIASGNRPQGSFGVHFGGRCSADSPARYLP